MTLDWSLGFIMGLTFATMLWTLGYDALSWTFKKLNNNIPKESAKE